MNGNAKKIQNIKRLKLAGILPRYIDSNNIQEQSGISTRNPLSKYYKTYEDYAKDKNNMMETVLTGGDIDEEVYKKLKETAEELGWI